MANDKKDVEIDPIENAKIKAPGEAPKGAQVATARAEQDKAAARQRAEQLRTSETQKPKGDDEAAPAGERQPIAFIAKNTKRVSLSGQFTHITAGKRLPVSAYGLPQIEKIRAQGVELDPVYE